MAKVQAVPPGYQTVTPHLTINGAAEAIEFYKKAFGAEERSRAPAPDGKIMHAEIKIGDSIIMLNDAMGGFPANQSSLHLYVPDADALWKRATDAGAKVAMPLADQVWGDRYGALTDKWGNRWSSATHKEDVPPQEMEKRMQEAMKQMPK